MDVLSARCRIGCQIAMLGLAGILGMLLIGGINRWGASEIERDDAAVTAAREAGDLESRLQIWLLQARRSEKNFLLRRDGESLTLHAAAIAATGETVNALEARLAGDPAGLEMVEKVKANTGRYAAAFNELVRGEAGRGFAVVASEVKQLANQTARSTEEINRQIGEVRSATAEAVTAVARIGSTIGEVNTIAASIAAAVEQQGAATAEIARGVTRTATAVNEMKTRNGEVSREAESAGRHAEAVLDGTHVLDTAISELRQALVRTVRTSTAEVDRRIFERHAVDMACQVEWPGQRPMAARVGDLSEGGARLTGAAGLVRGTLGTLRIGGLSVPLPFRVRDADGEPIGVSFETDDAGPGAVRALLAGQGRGRAA